VRGAATRAALQDLADALLDHENPGRHNEALMELGATVCTPRNPACPACPLRTCCAAYASGRPEAFPVASKKKPVPHVEVAVGVVEDDAGRVLVQRRPEAAMLGGLWEFPGGKRTGAEPFEAACAREVAEELGVEVEVGAPLVRVEHAYSHFTVAIHAFRCRLRAGEPRHHAGEPVRWVTLDELAALAMPRANRRIVEALEERARRPTLF
jgi:A/G-specific adenine glycosylase